MVGLAVELDEPRPKVIAGVAAQFVEAGQMVVAEDGAAVRGHAHEVGMERGCQVRSESDVRGLPYLHCYPPGIGCRHG